VYKEKIYDLEEKIFELENELEAKKQETRDLANIASVITSILDIESVLAITMEISIRQVSGEVGAILLLDGGDLAAKISWGVDAATLDSLKYKDDVDIAQYCLRIKSSLYENDCESLFPGELSIRGFMASPILSKENAIGVIVIFNKENQQEFTNQDCRSLEMICKFASVAIENANLLKEYLEKQKIEHELELARQVQTTFLPGEVKIKGLRVASNYIPARQVSGDYYDLIPISKDKLFFLVGDVTSKGAPAALVMTSVYSIIRAHVTSGQPVDVKKTISHLNDLLCNDIIKGRDMFITLFMGYIDMETGMMEYCNGGHPPALYYRASSRETIHLRPGGPLVGQFAGLPYQATRVRVSKGDRIFCYTDGLIEAENRRGELYGMARAEEFFKAGILLDTKRFSRVVKEEVDRFGQGAGSEGIDDLTTLVIDFIDEENLRKYEFTYASHQKTLEKMHADLNSIFIENNIRPGVANPFRVAVSEAVTNAMVHAHKGNSSKKVRLSIELNHSGITADIVDDGECHALDTIENRDLIYDPSAESGRGMGLIKRLADEVDIRVMPHGGLGVKIMKYLEKNLIRLDGGNDGHQSI
jgi:serine phosphatase RsbU (regulator of sigma subunit)/anti-sigma regulatory factor (Ser/Thr protein kinase)